MLISKTQFVEIIKKLKESDELVEKVNDLFNSTDEARSSGYINAGRLMISHEDIVVKLLETMFNDYDYISYWLYELNYGRNYENGCLKEATGKNINISTPEKLYDFLVKNMKEKNKNEE